MEARKSGKGITDVVALDQEPVENCEAWWADVEIRLERYRGIPGTSAPWGLCLNIGNQGRDETEARKFWGETLRRLGAVISKLPSDFEFKATATELESLD